MINRFGQKRSFLEIFVPCFIGFVFFMVFAIIAVEIALFVFGVTHTDQIGHAIGRFFGSVNQGYQGK